MLLEIRHTQIQYENYALCRGLTSNAKVFQRNDNLQALQELTELVKNSKVEDVVALLPTWAHFYRILTVDIDRKVREATQV